MSGTTSYEEDTMISPLKLSKYENTFEYTEEDSRYENDFNNKDELVVMG